MPARGGSAAPLRADTGSPPPSMHEVLHRAGRSGLRHAPRRTRGRGGYGSSPARRSTVADTGATISKGRPTSATVRNGTARGEVSVVVRLTWFAHGGHRVTVTHRQLTCPPARNSGQRLVQHQLCICAHVDCGNAARRWLRHLRLVPPCPPIRLGGWRTIGHRVVRRNLIPLLSASA